MSKEEKIKVLEGSYSQENKLAKIKVQKENGDIVTWALTPECFDSFLYQITGKNLEFSHEQRKHLCPKLAGIEFSNFVKIDLGQEALEDNKDNSLKELQGHHNMFDRYPFYEVQVDLNQEQEKNES